MRALMIPAALVLATSLAPAAVFAATHHTDTGTVKTVNATAKTVTLDDGKTFVLPKSAKADQLTTGEKVKVSYVMKGSKMDATSIDMAH